MDKRFINFLRGKRILFIKEQKRNGDIVFCIKIPYSSEDWEVLYLSSSWGGYEKELNFSGYYNIKEQKIYNPSYLLKYEMGEELILANSYETRQIEKELKEKVIQNLEEKFKQKDYIQPSKEIQDRKDYSLSYQAETQARALFLEGKTEPELQLTIDFVTEDYLKYISDRENYPKEFAQKYFSDEEKTAGFIYLKKLEQAIKEELASLKNNPALFKIKAIRDAVGKDIKTATVTIKKNNIIFSCKLPADKLRYLSTTRDWISSWEINPVKDRNEFERLFGRSADIRVPDIIKIEFSKKILYSEEKEEN